MLANIRREEGISCTIRLGRPVTSIVEHVTMFRTLTLVPITYLVLKFSCKLNQRTNIVVKLSKLNILSYFNYIVFLAKRRRSCRQTNHEERESNSVSASDDDDNWKIPPNLCDW